MKNIKILSVLLSLLLVFLLSACNNTPSSQPSQDDPSSVTPPENTVITGGNTVRPADYKLTQTETVNKLSALDDYGRSFGAVDGMTTKKKVGIFYFIWLGNHGAAVADTSQLSEAQLRQKLNTAADSGSQYYYGQPLYGYYNSADPWVIRKHIELFIMAGIDYICIDTTNGVVWNEHQDYRPTITNILNILLDYRSKGWDVPQVLFYTNTNSADNIRILYDAFYNTDTNPELDKYKPLWFDYADTGNANRKRKPWIVGTPPADLADFFYKRDSQWPVPLWNYNPDGFPWMSWVTTDNGTRAQHNHNGIMSVSVAQHISGWFSSSTDGSGGFNYGRGYSQTDNRNNPDRVNIGSNFQEQWDYALSQTDVNNIFITGWNEWCAQMQPQGRLVDCVTPEYSRDTEMMKGGYGDAFYIQLADNIRRFKGISSPGARTNPFATVIDLDGDDGQWEGTSGYLDVTGECAPRNFRSNMANVGNYTDNSGRNDISSVRVTYDNSNLYFRIECCNDITEYDGGDNWMNILISVSNNTDADWAGYHYVINRSVSGNSSSVERLSSDGKGSKVGEAQIRLKGKVLTVAVPRSYLGITQSKFGIEIKVADNVTNPTDIMDYYVSGDSAPCGRFNFTYTVK